MSKKKKPDEISKEEREQLNKLLAGMREQMKPFLEPKKGEFVEVEEESSEDWDHEAGRPAHMRDEDWD